MNAESPSLEAQFLRAENDFLTRCLKDELDRSIDTYVRHRSLVLEAFIYGIVVGVFSIIAALSLCSLSEAHAEKLNVKFLIAQPAQVERQYVEQVAARVKEIYLSQLGIRIRSRIRDSHLVKHSGYQLLDQRYSEFEAYDSKLSNRKRWIKVVLVPPWFDENGLDYSAGFAKEQHSIAIATIRGIRLLDGADRFDWDWLVIAHELAHCLGANHIDTKPNIMHSDAGSYASPDLKFLSSTKRQIRG